MMSAPSTTRFATRSYSRVAYDPGVKQDTDVATVPVVALHDLLGDRHSWKSVRDHFAATRRVILPDIRGHGASPTLTNQWYSVGELAADLIAILDAESIDRAHLVGHGLGAVIAFECAKRQPDRVATLTLIDPMLFSILDSDLDSSARTLRSDVRTTDRAAADASYKGLTDKALDLYLGERWGKSWKDDLPAPRLAAIRRHSASLSALLPALDSYSVDRSDVANIDHPTLIAVAENASAINQLTCDRLSNLLPHARLAPLTSGTSATVLADPSLPDLVSHFFDESSGNQGQIRDAQSDDAS